MDNKRDDIDLIGQYCANRDPALREEIILRFVPLVHYALGRLGISQAQGADYEDAASQGLLGLIEAIDRYDPAHGAQFSTYAMLRIRGQVIDHLRARDWLSRGARKRVRRIQEGITALWDRLQRAPTENELAEYLELSLGEVQQGLDDNNRVIVSLDMLVVPTGDEEATLHELVADDHQPAPGEAVEEDELRQALAETIRTLPEREQLILALYYYEELTFKEIGAVLSITESRVCQLHSRIITSLQAMLRENAARERRTPLVTRGGML